MTSMDPDVAAYLERVTPQVRRRDADTLLALIGRATGEQPRMWGPSIIGFGRYHYRYASGREGDGAAAAFAPRKAATTVYLPEGVGAYAEQVGCLGPVTTGVGCLYLKDLDQIDLAVLEHIVAVSYRTMTAGTHTERAAPRP